MDRKPGSGLMLFGTKFLVQFFGRNAILFFKRAIEGSIVRKTALLTHLLDGLAGEYGIFAGLNPLF